MFDISEYNFERVLFITIRKALLNSKCSHRSAGYRPLRSDYPLCWITQQSPTYRLKVIDQNTHIFIVIFKSKSAEYKA